MGIKEIIKNNYKFYISMGLIVLLGTIGITLAITIGDFNAIGVNTTASDIKANITYDTGYSSNITSTNNLFPISDSLVTGPNVTDTRVLKVKFNVTGVNNNPSNSIYDVAIHFNNIDDELKTVDLKWRLYKNETLISEGNLSPTFDPITNNRLVLTNTQQDLNLNTDKYTFLLWISESCEGDILYDCDSSMDQSKYLNKNLDGSIKIELATGSKKKIYIISYDENGGYQGTAPISQRKKHNESITLSTSELPSDITMTFMGWDTDPDAKEPTYYPGDEFTINADTTLYAIWLLLPM